MRYLGRDERATVRLAVVAGVALAAIAFSSVVADGAGATTLPAGYQETVVLSGLVNPTVVRFSTDGRVFVAEKSGLIKVFDGLTDTTPTVFADLRTNVHNFWDRGLLGLALAPGFPNDPSVYVLYTYDAAIGGNAPRWGSVGSDSDGCPTPPGATGDGCVVSGRLSRLQANGNSMTGPEQVLIEDWCQQYPSHSVGSLAFGSDGALYVSSGDGASFNFTDYGQDGSPVNPCGDPPGGVGGAMSPPGAEGGALRSQDVRTTADPAGLNGSILRVDPATGVGLPDNPLAFSSDPNARRIIAHGFRNPFRITVKPGTSEVWVGDVGWSDWEEIDVVTSQPDAAADNYGWPCYEGTGRQGGYDGANLTLCESLYAQPAGLFAPFFAYNHAAAVVAGEACATGSSSIAGLAFETGSNFPVGDDGALFFADYSRDCIWRIRTGSNGAPDPATVSTFAAGAANPVDLVFGPDGALYYPDFDGGAVRRISSSGGGDTTPPTVSIVTPAGGVSVSGSVTVSATAGDNVGVAGVQFKVDGVNSGNEIPSPPYSFVWNTTTVANGSHVLTATVRDAAGNVTTSSPVTVTVSNAAGSTRFVSDLPVVSETNGWGPVELDRSNGEAGAGDGGPLVINGVGYAKGLGVHAVADVVYAIPAGCTAFAAQVGVDDEVVGGNGSVVFEIWADGTKRVSSPRLTGADDAVALNADLTGASQLRLVVQNGGDDIDYDHADWGDARFLCGGGPANQPPTAVATGAPLTGAAPLAVTFDGSGSSDPDPGDVLAYAWDLDGDGQFDDATGAQPSWTYATAGTIAVRLQTSDGHGHTTTSSPVTVTVSNAAGSTRFVSDLPVVSETNGWGPVELDRSNGEAGAGDGGPLVINGVGYAKGLGVHAVADVVYAIPAGCTAFAAQVGVDDEVVGGNGSVVFEIWADGTKRVSSPRLTGADDAVALNADLTGASQLRLVVQNGGDDIDYDHADWGDARFLCGGGPANQPPTAVATGAPLTGAAPLAVTFDGSGSSDPDPGDVLAYAWDLDGDGQFDDATGAQPSWTYATAGTIAVRLQTSDGHGHTTTSSPVTVTPGNTAPTVSIASPAAGTTWEVGDPISFSATGSDAQDGQLPGTAFDWVVVIQHCPSNCHAHTYQTFDNTAAGSFPAPDHEYPSYIELRVTATDAEGGTATASLDLQPRTVDLTFASSPPGLQLAVGAEVATTPFTREVIIGSVNSVSAVTPQLLAGTSYDFASWSDGGDATHNVTALAAATTYTATYAAAADTTPPTVSVSAPANGSTVSGAVTVQATASDAGGMAGVQFKLDGANLGVEDTSSPYQAPWDTTTAASGQHTLTALARDASGNTATSAAINVTVQNSTACPTGQWKAEYFANRTLTGSPTVTRCESSIANDWGSGSPVTGIGANNFSVRWTGRFPFPAGSTTFFVTADDGVRLRVDGALAIDQWKDQSATTYRSRQTLAVGDHEVSIEYYEKIGLGRGEGELALVARRRVQLQRVEWIERRRRIGEWQYRHDHRRLANEQR